MSIARLVVLHHVIHHLRFQSRFVHRETQLVHPVVILEALLDVHLDNPVASILVGPPWFRRLEANVSSKQHFLLPFVGIVDEVLLSRSLVDNVFTIGSSSVEQSESASLSKGEHSETSSS